MRHAILFECFDPDGTDDPAKTKQLSEDYQRGYETGFAAAQAENAALSAELVQNLADFVFTYDEARGEITRSFRPFLEALITQFFPHFVQTSLIGQIVDHLEVMGAATSGNQLEIHVHPDDHPAVNAALMSSRLDVSVSSGPDLPQNCALVRQSGNEVAIDMCRVIAEISAILNAEETTLPKEKVHE